jgi:hypothetical protein
MKSSDSCNPQSHRLPASVKSSTGSPTTWTLIKAQLAQLPTRREVWQAAMLGMIGGAVAAVTLIEVFARSNL